jgi:methyl-accepting chemotaxis protein
MQNTLKRHSRVLAAGMVVFLTALSGTAQERPKDRDKDKPEEPAQAGGTARADELSPQVKEILAWANDFSKEITQVIESWISSNAITQDKMYSFLYYPLPETDPTKYSTDYDSLADKDFQAILDKYVAKSNLLIYAVATDKNGYVPTHNRQYSQPLTGNRAVDLTNNRTKRIFGDAIGFRAARNVKPYLVQVYSRDTGELIGDVSVPINIRGQHWGCIRIGFRQVDRQQ